jgi:formate dehydrogenase major subunit
MNHPQLCATDSLEAFGSCRLCLVEIEGRAARRPLHHAGGAEGMVVHTQTPRSKSCGAG